MAIADLGDSRRDEATEDESTPDRIRTCDLLIRSQQTDSANPEGNDDFQESAAPGAAASAENAPIDPDLSALIEAWPGLANDVKAGILAMVTAARRGGMSDGRNG